MVSQREADRVIEKIQPIGKEIGEASVAGNGLAKKVIDSYAFWRKCPGDAMALVLCEAAVDEYVAGAGRDISLKAQAAD